MRKNQQAFWISVAVGTALFRGVLPAEEAAKPTASSSALATWTLSTADTKLTLGVGKDQQLYLYESAALPPVGIGPAHLRVSRC